MKKLSWLAIAAASCISVAVLAETVDERIKPVGSVCMAGDACAAAVIQVAAAEGGGGRSGEDVFSKACTTCHTPGVAGAPKLGDKAAWAPRIEKGVDVLYNSAINGFNGMPAKGMCFDCSADELKATVDYMVEKSK